MLEKVGQSLFDQSPEGRIRRRGVQDEAHESEENRVKIRWFVPSQHVRLGAEEGGDSLEVLDPHTLEISLRVSAESLTVRLCRHFLSRHTSVSLEKERVDRLNLLI